jgi:hypothetical protein
LSKSEYRQLLNHKSLLHHFIQFSIFHTQNFQFKKLTLQYHYIRNQGHTLNFEDDNYRFNRFFKTNLRINYRTITREFYSLILQIEDY